MRRLGNPQAGASITKTEYAQKLSRLTVDTSLSRDQLAIVDALLDWPAQIGL